MTLIQAREARWTSPIRVKMVFGGGSFELGLEKSVGVIQQV